MNYSRTHQCAICGEERSSNHPRFLLAENNWEDKLTVLQWNEQLACRAGVQMACCIAHVEELVIHWITTGSLDYPFARTALGAAAWRHISGRGSRIDLGGARTLGELAVHRESIERVLAENPQSLQATLDALLDALRHETSTEVEPVALRSEEPKSNKELCAISSEPEL